MGAGDFPFLFGIANGGGIAARSESLLRGDNAFLREGEGLGSDAVAEGLLPVLGFFGIGVDDEPEVLVEASRRDRTSSSVSSLLTGVFSLNVIRAFGVGVSAREAALPLR